VCDNGIYHSNQHPQKPALNVNILRIFVDVTERRKSIHLDERSNLFCLVMTRVQLIT
jgi:hypothetical protein